jgi:phospholipid-binding lipoprotein MlaA
MMFLPVLAAGLMMADLPQDASLSPPTATRDAVAPVLIDADSAARALGRQPAPAVAGPTDAPGQPGGDIVVTGREKIAADPLEKLNAKSFKATQAVDQAVVEPVATAYNKGLPKPARSGIRNFLSNLQEPVVAAAYLLELKPGKAAETVGRFAINSSLGVFGLFDVAKRHPFYLPYRPNGLSDVLGYYGVGAGPYMYLPIIGPTTLRDLIGDTVDNLAVPYVVGKPLNRPSFTIPAMLLGQLGERAAFDDTIKQIRQQDDPYASYRTLYLNQRKAEIEALHGRGVATPAVPIYGRDMGRHALEEGAVKDATRRRKKKDQ